MLARPEVGTRAHILLWLAGKNPKHFYQWDDCDDCAVAQYIMEKMHRHPFHLWGRIGIDKKLQPLHELNEIAYQVADSGGGATFGDLYLAAQRAWNPEQKKEKTSDNAGPRFIVDERLQVHPRMKTNDVINAVLHRRSSGTSARRSSTGRRGVLQHGRKALDPVC
jgi:hypothetical protein